MNTPVDMIVCDACGCVVHPNSLDTHSDWHDSLEGNGPITQVPRVASPSRTQV